MPVHQLSLIRPQLRWWNIAGQFRPAVSSSTIATGRPRPFQLLRISVVLVAQLARWRADIRGRLRRVVVLAVLVPLFERFWMGFSTLLLLLRLAAHKAPCQDGGDGGEDRDADSDADADRGAGGESRGGF